MKIDLDKIKEIYGDNTIQELKNNLEDVIINIKYLKRKGFNNYFEILEMYPYMFLEPTDIFEDKINNFLDELGVEYIEILSNNISLWGEIEW